MKVHYGRPPWRASCGVRGLSQAHLSVERWAVTCAKCKGTRHWQTRFWETHRVEEED